MPNQETPTPFDFDGLADVAANRQSTLNQDITHAFGSLIGGVTNTAQFMIIANMANQQHPQAVGKTEDGREILPTPSRDTESQLSTQPSIDTSKKGHLSTEHRMNGRSPYNYNDMTVRRRQPVQELTHGISTIKA